MVKNGLDVESFTHGAATRKNIPTAELQSLVQAEDAAPKKLRYPRNTDLDPQLVWRGKDEQDWSDLVVQAPPLFIQEKVHPKVIIEDLRRQTKERKTEQGPDALPDLFGDFNGLPDPEARLEFYAHDQHWSNRLILGDSLQVMASLAEKEGLRGQVQCIYIDPPYGIRFNSNWQVSTRSRDVKDGKVDQITREPEQVKAFRDTWKDGIHSYLTYLRDRLTVCRDLLADSGSIFVQIGDENVHRVRGLMDEVFGEENFAAQITFKTTTGAGSFSVGTNLLASVSNHIIWFTRRKEAAKYKQLYQKKTIDGAGGTAYFRVQELNGLRRSALPDELSGQLTGLRLFSGDNLTSQTTRVGMTTIFPVSVSGREYMPNKGGWKTNRIGMNRLQQADRLIPFGNTLRYVRFFDDFSVFPHNNQWSDTTTAGFGDPKLYVVQTNTKVIERCVLMATDPGDLVLDPTCGSGTTAFVAEQWGRRWITIDTSRVALALARARLMGARYPYYLLADSRAGLLKEGAVAGRSSADRPTHGDIRQGFVYGRVPHVTLKSIANNAEIDVIWDKWQGTLEPLRATLNAARGRSWEDWEIPREAEAGWPPAAKEAHAKWWEARIARQQEIDASIARNAETEYLYDKPYEDKRTIRVAGPFTVESLSPHRVVPSDVDDTLWEELLASEAEEAGRPAPRRTVRPHQWEEATDFADMVLDHLKRSGVQQSKKEDRIVFTSLTPWPGDGYIAAEGRFMEGDKERKAGMFIGPEFGTVSRPDMVAAAREAREAGFDVLIACAFNYDAHASEFHRQGALTVIQARMNPDLHMADELKNTGAGNLFVVFGEPDIEIKDLEDHQIQVRILGVDVFDPQKGEVRSGDTDDIAAWFIDTDYNEESFFVRHAYFLGANDPYKALKTSLKAEIDEEAWASLYRDVSRPFPKPCTGRIAVKVINHFGDEVMRVFTVR